MATQDLPDWQHFKAFLQAALRWIVGTLTVGNLFARITFLIVLVSFVVVWQDRSRDVAIVGPIAVPKALADAGYTPEVAGNRLLDALNAVRKLADEPENSTVDETNAANSILAHASGGRDELPDFVVPEIGLSLSAIVSAIRKVTHHGDGEKVISGELIFRDKYALRVRVDGEEVFTSGFDSDDPDILLDHAAPAIVKKLWPAVGARVLYRTDPDQALLDAEDIIASFAESDPNVRKAYILKGDALILKGDRLPQRAAYAEAEEMFRKAISLKSGLWGVHNRLGILLLRQEKFEDALKQFETVVWINPKSAEGYINMGAAQFQMSKSGDKLDKARLDEARKSYEQAIELKPHDVRALINLGLVWNRENNLDSAMAAFRRAIKSDPNDLHAHWNLAADLAEQKEFDEALAEYRFALDCTEVARDLALLHIHIGNTLKAKSEGNLDGAIAEYRRAVEIDGSYAWTHNSLGEALRDLGKLDEAVAEFRAALEAALRSDDADAILTANKNLDAAPQVKDEVKEKGKPAGAYKEQALPASVRDAQAEMK